MSRVTRPVSHVPCTCQTTTCPIDSQVILPPPGTFSRDKSSSIPMNHFLGASLLLFALGPMVYGQARPEFQVSRAQEPPKIDGDLHDAAWADHVMRTGDWLSYNPL